MAYRKFDTCFFERYAILSLQTLLGHKFDDLVNEDRPDLQSADHRRLGIEVTRAMEQGKLAARQMLKDLSGISNTRSLEIEMARKIADSGYNYGLQVGKYVAGVELDYWKGALPMKQIIASKVAKVSSGFYGDFDEYGLFVFSHEPLTEVEAMESVHYTLQLQRDNDIRYDRLYLSGVDTFYACNLEDDISDSFRITELPITRTQRREFYLGALDYEDE